MSYAAILIFINIDITEIYFHNRVNVYCHSIMPIQKKFQMKIPFLIKKTNLPKQNPYDALSWVT